MMPSSREIFIIYEGKDLEFFRNFLQEVAVLIYVSLNWTALSTATEIILTKICTELRIENQRITKVAKFNMNISFNLTVISKVRVFPSLNVVSFQRRLL